MFGLKSTSVVAGVLWVGAAAAGCGRDTLPSDRSGAAGAGAVGAGGTTLAGVAGSGGGAPVAGSFGTGGALAGSTGTGGAGNTNACMGDSPLAPKRIVRLSSTQVANSIGALVDSRLTPQLIATHQLADAAHRTFPPLANPREGSVIGDQLWTIDDQIAQTAASHIVANFAAFTGCGDPPIANCARSFVTDFAGRAFRRPLTSTESDSLLQVYDETRALLGNDKEAVQFSVYATLSAPQFLYRTELGADAAAAGALTPYEVASQLSYFLTDAPPDRPLLDAAAAGRLSTAGEITAQVTRIVSSDAARRNLEAAMLSNFAITNIESVVVDSAIFPMWNRALSQSMLRESERFFRDTLWSGPLTDLLTTRRSAIDASLALLYDVPFPPAGAQPDTSGFAAVELPANRAGLLTQPAFLLARARPTNTWVVGRGLLVNSAILCQSNPPFPQNLQDDVAATTAPLANATEKEKAALRADPQRVCAACHPSFDPYGLALENYDVLGAYRTTDDMGRTIDASTTLPAAAGGAMVGNAVDMARELAKGNRFAGCVAQRLLEYALAEPVTGLAGGNSCAARAITSAFDASDRSFTALLREVVLSPAFSARRTAP